MFEYLFIEDVSRCFVQGYRNRTKFVSDSSGMLFMKKYLLATEKKSRACFEQEMISTSQSLKVTLMDENSQRKLSFDRTTFVPLSNLDIP